MRVSLSAQAAVVGQALGWPPAAVPDALVHVERVPEDLSEPMVVDTVVSDGLGVARFVGLPAGRYELRALRTFSEDERTRAASALGNADGLVGRASLQLGSTGTDTLRVDVTLSGGSSLLFTEITPAALPGPSGSQYYEGGYPEIFNNADTTIEIAGKLFFRRVRRLHPFVRAREWMQLLPANGARSRRRMDAIRLPVSPAGETAGAGSGAGSCD